MTESPALDNCPEKAKGVAHIHNARCFHCDNWAKCKVVRDSYQDKRGIKEPFFMEQAG